MPGDGRFRRLNPPSYGPLWTRPRARTYPIGNHRALGEMGCARGPSISPVARAPRPPTGAPGRRRRNRLAGAFNDPGHCRRRSHSITDGGQHGRGHDAPGGSSPAQQFRCPTELIAAASTPPPTADACAAGGPDRDPRAGTSAPRHARFRPSLRARRPRRRACARPGTRTGPRTRSGPLPRTQHRTHGRADCPAHGGACTRACAGPGTDPYADANRFRPDAVAGPGPGSNVPGSHAGSHRHSRSNSSGDRPGPGSHTAGHRSNAPGDRPGPGCHDPGTRAHAPGSDGPPACGARYGPGTVH